LLHFILNTFSNTTVISRFPSYTIGAARSYGLKWLGGTMTDLQNINWAELRSNQFIFWRSVIMPYFFIL